MDPHAQWEIQVFAKAMYELLKPIVPVSAEAFEDYRLESMHLTRLEIEAVRSGKPLATDNKREQAEWEAKRERLGLK
jgi:thymidylate synthase (FAD)